MPPLKQHLRKIPTTMLHQVRHRFRGQRWFWSLAAVFYFFFWSKSSVELTSKRRRKNKTILGRGKIKELISRTGLFPRALVSCHRNPRKKYRISMMAPRTSCQKFLFSFFFLYRVQSNVSEGVKRKKLIFFLTCYGKNYSIDFNSKCSITTASLSLVLCTINISKMRTFSLINIFFGSMARKYLGSTPE